MHSFNLQLRFSIARCNISAVLSCHVGLFFRAYPGSSKFLIQIFIACFEGTWPWRPKLKKTSELPLRTFQTVIVFVKHSYGGSTLRTVPLFHDYWMAGLSVAQGTWSAVLPTVHGCHYAFQKVRVLLCHPVPSTTRSATLRLQFSFELA